MRIIACSAGPAETTTGYRMHDDRIPDRYIAYRRSDLVDPACILMPQCKGKRTIFLLQLALNHMQIGATETGTTNTHNHIMGIGNLWLGNFFNHWMLGIMMQTYSFHRSPSMLHCFLFLLRHSMRSGPVAATANPLAPG